MFEALKKLFSGKEEKIELELNNIIPFLNESKKAEIKKEKKRLISSINEIKKRFSHMMNVINELNKKKSENDFVNNIKSKFCERSLSLLSSTINKDYDDISRFLKDCNSTIDSINKISFKELHHLREFRKDMIKIASQAKLLERELRSIDEKAKSGIITEMEKINNETKKIRSWIKELNELNNWIASNEKLRIGLEQELVQKRQELDDFLSSDDFQKLDVIKNEIAELENEQMNIKQRIATQLGSLNKIMKKFYHELDAENNTLTKEQQALLAMYIENPASAFLEDGKMEIKNIVEQMKWFVNQKKLVVDEKKRDKIAGLEINALLSLRSEFTKISNKISEQKERLKELSVLLEKKKSREQELNSIEERINEMKNVKQEKEARSNEIRSMITRKKAELSAKLSNMLNSNVFVK